MKITIDLEEATANGLKTLQEKVYTDCPLETVASQLLTKTLKEMGYVIDVFQTGTSPENLNSSNDD